MTTETSRPSVLLIYTGGTIGMIRNPETGALESFTFDHLVQHIPELKQIQCHISSVQFNPPIDSSDMDPQLWVELARIIYDNYDLFDGFVVLHGSDTMAYTASAMSFALENLAKPVIFTGSQLPIGVLRTDGKENLITAIEIATAKRPDGSPMVPEVCILFQDQLLRGNRTTKVNAWPTWACTSISIPAAYCRPRHPRRPSNRTSSTIPTSSCSPSSRAYRNASSPRC